MKRIMIVVLGALTFCSCEIHIGDTRPQPVLVPVGPPQRVYVPPAPVMIQPGAVVIQRTETRTVEYHHR